MSIETLRSALNVIETSGSVPEAKKEYFRGLIKAAEAVLDEATACSLGQEVNEPEKKRARREGISERFMFYGGKTEDFIVHAMNEFPAGRSFMEGVIKFVGKEVVCQIPLYGPNGKLLLAANSVIYDYDWDDEESRLAIRTDEKTVIVCKLEMLVSPVLVVHMCT